MIRYVRAVPLHRWLRRIAIGLTVLVVPHIMIVMTTHMATPIVNAHMLATVGLFIFAKLEEQSQARRVSARSTRELTEATRR